MWSRETITINSYGTCLSVPHPHTLKKSSPLFGFSDAVGPILLMMLKVNGGNAQMLPDTGQRGSGGGCWDAEYRSWGRSSAGRLSLLCMRLPLSRLLPHRHWTLCLLSGFFPIKVKILFSCLSVSESKYQGRTFVKAKWCDGNFLKVEETYLHFTYKKLLKWETMHI